MGMHVYRYSIFVLILAAHLLFLHMFNNLLYNAHSLCFMFVFLEYKYICSYTLTLTLAFFVDWHSARATHSLCLSSEEFDHSIL